MVCLNDILQGHMFIAVARLRIFFRHRQPYGFLRTGMGAGQTCLAVSRSKYRPVLFQSNRRGRAYPFTNPGSQLSTI